MAVDAETSAGGVYSLRGLWQTGELKRDQLDRPASPFSFFL